jgi:mRNA degradation ribonuclease J1/J2
VSPEDSEGLIPAARKRVIDMVKKGGEDLEKQIASTIKSHLYNETRRRPTVLVSIARV